jgi:hypothetical protein
MLNLAIVLLSSLLYVQSYQHHLSNLLTTINNKKQIKSKEVVTINKDNLISKKFSLHATVTYDYPMLDRIDKVKSLLDGDKYLSVYDNCTVLDAVETMNAQNRGSVLIIRYHIHAFL